jgi:hypothetical protein
LVILVLAPVWRLGRILRGMSQPNTAELARTWVLQNIPEGASLIVEPYAPELPLDRFKIIALPNATWYYLDRYRSEKIDYFIVTEGVYGKISEEVKEGNPDPNYQRAALAYQELIANSDLVYEIKANDALSPQELLYAPDWTILASWRAGLRLGPFIEIYRLR